MTIDNDNGVGLELFFRTWVGSDYTDSGRTGNTWNPSGYATENILSDDIADWGGSTSAFFDVTGVQLEVGEKASPFEHRSYGDELARCQRYYQQTSGTFTFIWSGDCTSGETYYLRFPFPTTMRATPTITLDGTQTDRFNGTTFTANARDEGHISVGCTANSTGSRGYFEGSYRANAEL